MRFEEAYYYNILLMSGLNDEFDNWLNQRLEEQDPLSDMVLQLVSCGSDVNKTISCLHDYCRGQDIDEKTVCEKLRLFLKNAYHCGRFNKEQVVFYMSRFCVNHGDVSNYDMKTWGCMFYMGDYYAFAKEGLITWERFDSAFLSYLDDGNTFALDRFSDQQEKNYESILKRIINLFRK